ncbi:hypothetical protein [Curtobacterium aurantiacum]|uniref:hypothetical protein n=1 Tax=Curtobacterium aurantiacum TaxID=3236919 RepID=UPI001BE01A27|nr:hypothetical protein [Curtobacterium flaccumfaciens]MBT1676386.1 hypothetical protein [Curtobacterium flaccumfaciens pv. flaccumfaciens]
MVALQIPDHRTAMLRLRLRLRASPARSRGDGRHLNVRQYEDLLARTAQHATDARFYAFDLTLEETVRRHATRPKVAEFDAERVVSRVGRPIRLTMVDRTLDWTSDIARSEVRPTDPARLERAATLAVLRAGRTLTG